MSISGGFISTPASGRAATTATRHIVLNISLVGVKATIDPESKRLDCSQTTFLPALLRENVILAPIPVFANVNPVM